MNRLRVAVIVTIAGGGLACLTGVGPRALWALSNPLSTEVKRDYQGVRDFFLRAAEKMPEADYGFKPSPEVRSFAQQVAHVADDQYNLCAKAKGEARQAAGIEDSLSRKADLVPALQEAFAYCDGAYDALTDASGAEIPKAGNGGTKLSWLNVNVWHTWEHYGNVVVYLRMKGLVPPSSERKQMKLRAVAVMIAGGGLAWLMSVGPGALWAQSNPLTTDMKRDYKAVRDYFIRAAEKMPEAEYGFKPSPDVRSFGQQVAHVADDQYNLCAPAKGETRNAAYTAIEASLSKKADLVPALKEAFAYCDAAYDALTDASGAEIAKGGKMRNRFSWLNWNLWHTWEHYGNVVVYLRMKGLLPPSSERMQMK